MSEVVRGKKYYDRVGEIRVMTVSDGYAMCRRPGCAPFVVSVKNLREGYIHLGGQRHDLTTENASECNRIATREEMKNP